MEKKTKECAACRQKILDIALFCPECGANLSQTSVYDSSYAHRDQLLLHVSKILFPLGVFLLVLQWFSVLTNLEAGPLASLGGSCILLALITFLGGRKPHIGAGEPRPRLTRVATIIFGTAMIIFNLQVSPWPVWVEITLAFIWIALMSLGSYILFVSLGFELSNFS